MEDGLACSLANVEHGAIAIFNAALAGNVRSSQMASANCIGILARSFFQPANEASRDRKSTRLNSSHANISYAVFCLKKKNSKSGHNRTAKMPDGICYRLSVT